MQRIISILLVTKICLATIVVQSTNQLAWGQIQNSQGSELQRLLNLAQKQTQQGQPQQAIKTLQEVLTVVRRMKNRKLEATALFRIAWNFINIRQPHKALEFFSQALPITQEIGSRADEATILNDIGRVYLSIGQPYQALKSFNQVLPIMQEINNRTGEAETFNYIGEIYQMIGQPGKALESFNQALPITREINNRTGETAILNNIGEIYQMIGQPGKALESFNQALPITREINNRTGEAAILNNIGEVYRSMGQPQKALEFLNQALPTRQEVGDRLGEAVTLNNIGEVYRSMGQPQKALEFLNQALPIRQEVGDRLGEAKTLNNIGEVYRSMGRPQKALEFLNQALHIMKNVNSLADEATTLNNIATVYNIIGQPQKALEFFNQALSITQKVNDRAGEAANLNNMAGVYYITGEMEKSLEFLNKALTIMKDVGDRRGEATTLNNIGEVYRITKQPENALESLKQALTIMKDVGDRTGEATILNNIGEVYRITKHPEKALESLKQALTIMKDVGDRTGETKIMSNIGALYQDMGQLTKAVKHLEQAVRTSLEIRGGLIRENRLKFLQAGEVTPTILVNLLIKQNQAESAYEWANLATTADLIDYTRLINAKVKDPKAQQAIDEWKQQNQQLVSLRKRLNEKFSETLSRQMREQETKVNQQAENISRRFPEVADLFETKPTDIAKLKASIPVGTTVIHPVLLTKFANVPDTIALFVLTRDKLTVKTVPAAKFDALLTQTYTSLTNRFDDEYYLDNLEKLYDLLIRPVEAEIQVTNPKKLSIIATGKLRYIPFEALYDGKTNQYLIQKYPVSYLTRLSTRSLQAKGTQTSTSAKKVLAFGNPVTKPPLALPRAEAEVKSITRIFPGSETFINSKATLSTFKIQSPRFSLLHLATHGCFQKGGCPKLGLEENVLLFADQKFNIRDAALLGLQNVDLIVLSACQTALETNSNGEEIAGLAYLFERAGAKAVIASLWSAEDSTTQEIMVQFYENLKKGMSKDEALRQAKLSQIDSHPFFWSPFAIIGDGR